MKMFLVLFVVGEVILTLNMVHEFIAILVMVTVFMRFMSV